jgi:phosphonoacetaldehyde hydrolase
MNEQLQYLTAVVLDWAGTTVDHGSCAPAAVFVETFRRRGVTITTAQAREPMGRAKRDHIAAIAAMPAVASAWLKANGAECSESDIDEMYHGFLPLQQAALHSGSDVIAGVPAAVDWCRSRGLKIGSSTGYTPELMQTVSAVAREQGYEPDCVLCAGDTTRGRPAPYMLHEAAQRMDVYPMWSIVKVDDTPIGIQAGRNAGCWTVGVTRTGNCVGLSLAELQTRSDAEVQDLCAAAARQLTDAGAHAIIESVADLPDVILDLDRRAKQGELPI